MISRFTGQISDSLWASEIVRIDDSLASPQLLGMIQGDVSMLEKLGATVIPSREEGGTDMPMLAPELIKARGFKQN